MSKFLPAIIFFQLVTSGLVLIAFNWSADLQLLTVIIAIAIISAVLTAFGFSAIARNMFIDEQAKMQERHAQERENIRKQFEREKNHVLQEKSQLQDKYARERESILLAAERDKANTVVESYRKIAAESRKAHAKANFKVGVAFTVAVGAGGVMVFSQLVTVGMMVMVAAGSGLSGYILRARQDSLSRRQQLAHNASHKITDQSNIIQAEQSLLQDDT
jgi:purine-cytosine permease-like protein